MQKNNKQIQKTIYLFFLLCVTSSWGWIKSSPDLVVVEWSGPRELGMHQRCCHAFKKLLSQVGLVARSASRRIRQEAHLATSTMTLIGPSLGSSFTTNPTCDTRSSALHVRLPSRRSTLPSIGGADLTAAKPCHNCSTSPRCRLSMMRRSSVTKLCNGRGIWWPSVSGWSAGTRWTPADHPLAPVCAIRNDP